jgi:hypothetical protein
MAARGLVFEAGDRVRTWGRFVAGADGDWLDLARVHDLIFRPAGWKSDRSIRLIGADAEEVRTGWAPNRVPGYISVVGTWREESIEVEEQSAELPARERFAAWRDPPCPPPPGGWRRDVLPWNLDCGDLESSGAMVGRVVFRPSADQEVLVVAASDLDAVTRQLSPHLPHQLCVVPSRFTRAEIDEVCDVLLARSREWRLESFGTGADGQAQPFITAELFRVTAEMAEWADMLPERLLRLRPALRPA